MRLDWSHKLVNEVSRGKWRDEGVVYYRPHELGHRRRDFRLRAREYWGRNVRGWSRHTNYRLRGGHILWWRLDEYEGDAGEGQDDD
jgi:hypothetical protein